MVLSRDPQAEVPGLNTYRLRSYRVASTPAASAKLAAADVLSHKFGPSLPLGEIQP